VLPPTLNAGPNLADSFISSPVFNFPIVFGGPFPKLAPGVGTRFTAFGIWNASSLQTEDFTQRYDQYDLSGRIPIFQTDCMRCYGLLGFRAVWMWERYRWRVVSNDTNGDAVATDVAIFTNTVSNRLYGIHVGGGTEWQLGTSPIGAFAFSVDLQGGLYADFVKEQNGYELGDLSTRAQRSTQDYQLVPEIEAALNFWWYPSEGIQVRLGYSAMCYFNTIASPRPVSFNFGALDPPFERGVTRLIEGLNVGVGFIF
jgi:hypothetical protein